MSEKPDYDSMMTVLKNQFQLVRDKPTLVVQFIEEIQ
jgi:hypothetical protein